MPRYTIERQQGGAQMVSGLCIDILRAIEHVDPEIQFSGDQVALPLRRAVQAVEHGEIDAYCGLNKNDEREKIMQFVEPPL